MIATPLTADYVGTRRHECPECHRPDWNVISDIDYCEWIDCGWEAEHGQA